MRNYAIMHPLHVELETALFCFYTVVARRALNRSACV